MNGNYFINQIYEGVELSLLVADTIENAVRAAVAMSTLYASPIIVRWKGREIFGSRKDLMRLPSERIAVAKERVIKYIEKNKSITCYCNTDSVQPLKH